MAPQFTEFQTITLESISRSRQRICVKAQSSSKSGGKWGIAVTCQANRLLLHFNQNKTKRKN